MEAVIKTAILGFGLSGRVFHAPILQSHPGFEVSKILQRHGESSKEVYPEVQVVSTLKDIMDDQAIDLAVIATPNTTHFDFAKDLLEAGKHIVIEKPFTNTTSEADRLIELSKSTGKKIFVYQNRRWDGDFLTIKKLLQEQLLGELVEYEAHFDRFNPVMKPHAWRDIQQPGGGIVYDLGPHLIDQALFLFGLPNAVFADIRMQRPGSQVDDYFEIILYYSSMKVTLKAGMMVKAPLPRYIIHGHRGSFVKYGFDPQEEALKRGHMPEGDRWGVGPEENHGLLMIEENGISVSRKIVTKPGCYQAFYDNVYDVITRNVEQAVKPEEAREVIRIIEEAFRSSREKRIIDNPR